MSNSLQPDSEMIVYQSDDGRVRLHDCQYQEAVWLTKGDRARLFDCSVDNISVRLRNLGERSEFRQEATAEDFPVVHHEGARQVHRTIRFNKLDPTISVGYPAKSVVATHFRQRLLQEPTPFERHYLEAEQRLKRTRISKNPEKDDA